MHLVRNFTHSSRRNGGLYETSDEVRAQRAQTRVHWEGSQCANLQAWICHENEDNLKFCWTYAQERRGEKPQNVIMLAKLLRYGVIYGPPAYFVTLATHSRSTKWDAIPVIQWRSEVEKEIRRSCGGRVPALFIPELSWTRHRHFHAFIWLPEAYRWSFSTLGAEESEVERLCRRIWGPLVPYGSCEAALLYTYVDWCRAANYCAKNACVEKPGAKFQALGKFRKPDRVRVPMLSEPPGESSTFWWPRIQGLVGREAIERSRWQQQ
jgi:hypothetical protein